LFLRKGANLFSNSITSVYIIEFFRLKLLLSDFISISAAQRLHFYRLSSYCEDTHLLSDFPEVGQIRMFYGCDLQDGVFFELGGIAAEIGLSGRLKRHGLADVRACLDCAFQVIVCYITVGNPASLSNVLKSFFLQDSGKQRLQIVFEKRNTLQVAFMGQTVLFLVF
jgi:hypothetical protein